MNRNILKYILLFAALWLVIAACEKDATSYRDYLAGAEKVYPGLPSGITTATGNYRIQLTWKPSPDPSISHYRVFWNNGKDSVQVSPGKPVNDSLVSVVIQGLTEYTYTFVIYSYDAKGNRSIPIEVSNVKVYGDNYKQGLTNRYLNTAAPYVLLDQGIVLNFLDADTINVGTSIRYTTKNNMDSTVSITADQSSIMLFNYLPGTKVYFQSAYIPTYNSIDTFYTSYEDSLANIISPLDKSLFSPVILPNDVGYYDSYNNLTQLWNGNTSPTSYPDIYHSDASHPLPHHFTFDLGKTYGSLAQFEIIGRDCCNNPVSFEIWGIDDLTNAITTLPSNDPGWKDEAISKGWKLLKTVYRTDDGVAPYKISFDEDVPAVRYIRIRILAVASGDGYFSNISELSFWSR